MTPVKWIESPLTGYWHAYAYSPHAIIMGFPQRTPEMAETFGALIIVRAPIGTEPKCVALKAHKGTFKIVKEYAINEDDDIFDYAYQALALSFEQIIVEWEEWLPFLRDMTVDALLAGMDDGKSIAPFGNMEIIEA